MPVDAEARGKGQVVARDRTGVIRGEERIPVDSGQRILLEEDAPCEFVGVALRSIEIGWAAESFLESSDETPLPGLPDDVEAPRRSLRQACLLVPRAFNVADRRDG